MSEIRSFSSHDRPSWYAIVTIRRRGDAGATPGQELKHFTDREDAQAVFLRLLNRPVPADLPVLMFYGVGGRGKSWLLKHLHAARVMDSGMPSAFIDFDPA